MMSTKSIIILNQPKTSLTSWIHQQQPGLELTIRVPGSFGNKELWEGCVQAKLQPSPVPQTDGSTSAPRDEGPGRLTLSSGSLLNGTSSHKHNEWWRSFITYLRSPIKSIGDGILQTLCLTTIMLSLPKEHLRSTRNVFRHSWGDRHSAPPNVAYITKQMQASYPRHLQYSHWSAGFILK